MLGRSKQNGKLFNLYPWSVRGAKYCSNCGKRLDVDEYYTRHTIYSPINRKEAYIALCTACFPVEKIDDVSTPVPVEYKETIMQDIVVVRENSPVPKSGTGWERMKPTHVDEVLTQDLGAQRGIRTALRRVFN